jgi:N-acetyl-gamma-glutamyl-phosphate reductase
LKTVGIVNVTGYAGVELARLLLRHPRVQVTQVTGRSEAGKPLAEVFPHLAELNLTIQPDIDDSCDVVFVALPHKAAAVVVPDLLANGAKVVDISADFRLHDVETYQQWYQVTHPCPELLSEAVYGLPELHRHAIRQARLVANPGCYPTAGILALAPIAHLLVGPAIVDAKSGVSGSGRSLSLSNHYSEVNENVQAYSLGGHRHLPEITQELGELRATRGLGDSPVLFVPHLIPMTRGILATCYGTLVEPMPVSTVRDLYCSFYDGHPFVRIVAKPPQTKHTLGSNLCLIYPTIDQRTGQLLVISCIDNLVKGASGQAIQNMNLMLGLDETVGVDVVPVYP